MKTNKIIQGDCLEVMRKFPDKSIDLVITSPPYNKGYYRRRKPNKHDSWKYSNIVYDNFKDNLEPTEYAKWQTKVLFECVRIIKPSGSVFYNHKSIVNNHHVIFPKFVFDFNVRQVIIWDRRNSPQIEPIRFLPTTEYIFWITKTNKQPKFSKKDLLFKSEVWTFSAKPMPEHPAPFPIELPTNCILATTDKDDIVLDPFAGSGSTLVACKKLNRRYIGIEISPEYAKMSEDRLRGIEESLF